MKCLPNRLPVGDGTVRDNSMKAPQTVIFRRLEKRRRRPCHAEGRGFESLQPLRERPAKRALSLRGAVEELAVSRNRVPDADVQHREAGSIALEPAARLSNPVSQGPGRPRSRW